MSQGTIARRSLGACAAIAALLATLPAAATAATSTTCTAPALSQVFSWAGDTNWYAALPGASWDSFGSTGWTLSGGAKVIATTTADGKKGTLLDLPSGAKAVSPTACVTNDYPSARGQVRNLMGTAGVTVSVAYMGTSTWGPTQASGTITGVGTGWTLPKAISIKPNNVTGWQKAQFTFAANGLSSEYYVSNFYVDPRMH